MQKPMQGQRLAQQRSGTGGQKHARAGVRQPIGVDIQGRSYWALGSRAGAWRVFVEEPAEQPAPSLWGYYEGPPSPQGPCMVC